MSAHQVFRLRNSALLMALAAAFPVISYAAGIANIDFASGGVTAVDAVGVQRPLTRGAEIGNGDTVRTDDGGRAQVRFSDGALVSLQPQTEFRIDNYRYSGKDDGQEKGFFSLLKGGLRTITGLVGRSHRDNYKITTSVATIGIRGTEYTATLDPAAEELRVHTGEGLVEVCNDAGCVLLAAGESGVVGGRSVQPQRTDVRPQLPPAQADGSVLPVFSVGDNFAGLNLPTSPMPTLGTATYSTILAKSGVIDSNGILPPGTLNSAAVSVNFGALTANTSLSGMVGGQSFSVTGSGSVSGNTMSSPLNGLIGATSCNGSVSGTFYGSLADHVGISYTFTDTVKTFNGTAVLGQ